MTSQQAKLQTPAPVEYPSLPSQGSYGDHSNLPRMPSAVDPTLRRGPSTADPSDQRFSTIDPEGNEAKPTKKAKKAREAAKRGGKNRSKKPLIFFLVLVILGAAAAASLYLTKYSKNATTAAKDGPREIQNAVSQPNSKSGNDGAGTAASILKAANQNAGVLPDAGAGGQTLDSDAAPTEQAAIAEETDAAVDEASDTENIDAGTDEAALAVEKPPQSNDKPPQSNDKTKTNRAPPVVRKPASKEPGFLTVSSTPYATVFVDGKKKGFTPIVKLKLAPGTHRLKLVSSVDGAQKKISVRIVSGGEVRHLAKF